MPEALAALQKSEIENGGRCSRFAGLAHDQTSGRPQLPDTFRRILPSGHVAL